MCNNSKKLKRELSDLAVLADESDCKFVSSLCLMMIRFLDMPARKQTLLMWMMQNLCDLVDSK